MKMAGSDPGPFCSGRHCHGWRLLPRSQPQRIGDDAEDLGVVHRAVHPFAAPIAVRMTSSPECTLAPIIAGRLPGRSTAPGTSLYLSLALKVPASSPFTVGSLGLSSFGRKVS